MTTRLIARLAATAALALTLAPAAQAQPVTIDFAEFRSDVTTGYQATPGGDVYSKGFAFWAQSSNALATWGTEPEVANSRPSNLGGTAAALFSDTFGEGIDMYAYSDPTTDPGGSGRAFNLYSMQVAHLYGSDYLTSLPDGGNGTLSPINFRVVAWTTPDGFGNASFQSVFTLPAPTAVGGLQTPLLYTLNFSNAWRGVTRVRFFNGSYNTSTGTLATGSTVSMQFTNIRAEVIPEPSTYVLLGSGLVVLLGVAQRRRRSA